MDQGGELWHNPAITNLFREFGYETRPTGADASNQNGPVERLHLMTFANAVRKMLFGAAFSPKFKFFAHKNIINSIIFAE